MKNITVDKLNQYRVRLPSHFAHIYIIMERWSSWFKAPVLKTGDGVSRPRVRIPISPGAWAGSYKGEPGNSDLELPVPRKLNSNVVFQNWRHTQVG